MGSIQRVLMMFSMGVAVFTVVCTLVAQQKIIRSVKENQQTAEDGKLVQEVLFVGLAVIEVIPLVAVIFAIYLYGRFWH
ncbi:MAG: hypothetical protein LBT32_06555 [Peptococcaceae bacterium]|jgi:F0F1-type ATP synthase membrane subunit c/vacuolar-type H+-ATPase subunit K|nr:hypothetical protein [Peptococcaceae bacterium]